jgi:hypothetical protein
VGTFPLDDVHAVDRAQQFATTLGQAGIPAAVLLDTAYPDLQLIQGLTPKPAYLVYLGPFASQADASAACPSRPDIPGCWTVRPSPNGR